MKVVINGIPYYNILWNKTTEDGEYVGDLFYLGCPYDQKIQTPYITNYYLNYFIKKVKNKMDRIEIYKSGQARKNIEDGLSYLNSLVDNLTDAASKTSHVLLYVDLYTSIITNVYDMLLQNKPHEEIISYMDKALNKDYYKKEWKK